MDEWYRSGWHRLPEQGIHGSKEFAKLPNEAKQWQLSLDRIQVLELHLGVLHAGMFPASAATSRRDSPTGMT